MDCENLKFEISILLKKKIDIPFEILSFIP